MLIHRTDSDGNEEFLSSPSTREDREVFERMEKDSEIVQFDFIDCPRIAEKVRYRKVTEIQAEKIVENRRKFTERIHALHDRQAEAKRNAIRKLIDELIQETSDSVKSELIEEIRRKTIDLHEFGEEM